MWGIAFYITAFPVIGASASAVEYVRQQLLSQPPVPAGNGTVDAILPLVSFTDWRALDQYMRKVRSRRMGREMPCARSPGVCVPDT